MWSQTLFFICFIHVLNINAQDDEQEEMIEPEKGDKKLSDNILLMLEHFKQPDPIGLPGADIPDPYYIPDTKHSILFGTTIHFRNTAIYGISQFRILYINAEIERMEVDTALSVDNLQARGNYTKSPLFGFSTHGPFTVNITGLNVKTKVTLAIDREGKLNVDNIEIDAEFDTINTKFEHLDLVSETIQGLVNSGGSFLFNTIKPYILKEACAKIRTTINTKLKEVADVEFPNSISPLDMVIIDARNKIRDMHLDPYQINDFSEDVSIFSVKMYDTWISGISAFYRVDNITLKMENNTITMNLSIGTQKLQGTIHWIISMLGGLISNVGTGSFSIEYMNAKIILIQPLDTSITPTLKNLNLEIGNIQIRCDTGGSIDYIMEFSVNILPNLLRYQIVHSIEGPLKEKLQEELDTINIEDLIKEYLPNIDELHNIGLKLSNLKTLDSKDNIYDEDEFFNF